MLSHHLLQFCLVWISGFHMLVSEQPYHACFPWRVLLFHSDSTCLRTQETRLGTALTAFSLFWRILGHIYLNIRVRCICIFCFLRTGARRRALEIGTQFWLAGGSIILSSHKSIQASHRPSLLAKLCRMLPPGPIPRSPHRRCAREEGWNEHDREAAATICLLRERRRGLQKGHDVLVELHARSPWPYE